MYFMCCSINHFEVDDDAYPPGCQLHAVGTSTNAALTCNVDIMGTFLNAGTAGAEIWRIPTLLLASTQNKDIFYTHTMCGCARDGDSLLFNFYIV